MSVILLSAFTVILLGSNVNCARILAVFPAPSISHQITSRPFTQELARRGHEVTVITPDPAFPKGGAPENLTEIDIHDISYRIWSKLFLSNPTVSKEGAHSSLKTIYQALILIVEAQLNNEEVQKILHDENKRFDLLIIEACVRPTLVLTHKYETPLILFSSFGGFHDVLEAISGPFHPVFHPEIYQHRLHDLSIWENLEVAWSKLQLQNIVNDLEDAQTDVGRQMFGPTVPTISELTNNVDMVFLNMRASWDNFRPAPPGLLHLGGLISNIEKELPKDLKSYLDSSANGVIYVSFGTNVLTSQIPQDKRDILIKVFSKLPYNVICKWGEELSEYPKNLKLGTWFPQSDLLRHPNVKLFITQGGLQSTDEALTAGVPLLGIPMITDQWYNVEQYSKFGIGTGLILETLTEENLLEAINKVIGNPSYRRNIVRYRSLMLDQPQSSLERAVWWTEYLLRHGGKHLRSPAANMPLAQYLELELVISSVLLVFVSIFVLIFTMCSVICIVKRSLMAKIKH